MIVGVHQPNYLPYMGFFDKMKKSDIFVIYDDAQFVKSDFQHRNKIKIYHGWKWLTVPVYKKRLPISEIKIKNDVDWAKQHISLIKDNYKKADYFTTYCEDLCSIYSGNYEYLYDLNMELIFFLKEALSIDTKIVLASDLDVSGESTERLIQMVQCLGGDSYLSGPSGINYLNASLFEINNIDLIYQDYVCPNYKQQYDNFIPNLSAIDFLLNVSNVL